MAPKVRALTLIEVLIVVLVLGILAVVVAPQFSRADSDTRFEALKTDLLNVRGQIRLYQVQHENRYPILAGLREQLTMASNAAGQTSRSRDQAHTLGPYLQVIPPNPYTGANKVSAGAVGTSDWYYDQETGLFRANHDPAFIAY